MKVSNRKTLFARVITLLPALGMALVCGTAMGQEEADDSEFLLEDVVVTSEFREKSIQDTPLAITAFSAEMLEMRNQNTIDEITWQTPSVHLRPGTSGFGNNLTAYIRGVGQNDFSPHVEAGVGIYADEVYYSTITGNALDLMDLERVEVLRGPQGVLGGRNSMGGAIKLFSRKADGSQDGYVSLTVGDLDRLDVKAAAGFQLIPDKLFVRIAGTSRSKDGYVTRYDYACVHNSPPYGTPGGIPTYIQAGTHGCELGTEGGTQMTAGRLSLRWVVTDDFEINFSTNIVNDKSESTASVITEVGDHSVPSFSGGDGGIVPIFFDNDGDGAYTPGIDVAYDNRFAVEPGGFYNYKNYTNLGISTPNPAYQGGIPGEGMNAFTPLIVPPINHLDSRDYNLNIDWQLSDNVSLLSVTSYREYTNPFGDERDGAPAEAHLVFNTMEHEQFIQELRLNASLRDGFAYLTLGAFYLDSETAYRGRIALVSTAMDFIHGPDTVPSTSKAAYGHVTLDLTERMDLALGLRYTEDEKGYSFRRTNPDGTAIEYSPIPFFFSGAPSNSGLYGTDGLSINYSFDYLDYRVALDYDINEDVMVYGQVASGHKAGGNSIRLFWPEQLNAFGPEELVNYEVGVKSTFFDRLRMNAQVFFSDYTDIQVASTTCAFVEDENKRVPCGSQVNAGNAEVKGFELDGTWRPTDALSFDFSYAYNDFKYTKINPELTTAISEDSTTPYTPEQTWSIGLAYRLELGNGLGTLTPRVDFAYQDEVFAGADNTSSLIDDYYNSSGRLTWRSEDGKWEAAIIVTNLLDEYAFLSFVPNFRGISFGTPLPPRQFAFNIKHYFFTD